LNPISVKREGGKTILVAGRHRIAACAMLGWSELSAVVLDLDSLDAEAAAIDENIARSDLKPLDLSLAIARRKTIY
jgi:ParB-like chromosome segregation protein Spo0J